MSANERVPRPWSASLRWYWSSRRRAFSWMSSISGRSILWSVTAGSLAWTCFASVSWKASSAPAERSMVSGISTP
jgi:hypothetical protein